MSIKLWYEDARFDLWQICSSSEYVLCTARCSFKYCDGVFIHSFLPRKRVHQHPYLDDLINQCRTGVMLESIHMKNGQDVLLAVMLKQEFCFVMVRVERGGVWLLSPRAHQLRAVCSGDVLLNWETMYSHYNNLKYRRVSRYKKKKEVPTTHNNLIVSIKIVFLILGCIKCAAVGHGLGKMAGEKRFTIIIQLRRLPWFKTLCRNIFRYGFIAYNFR